jgi:adenosylcobinamide-GDP ribazoletransferase
LLKPVSVSTRALRAAAAALSFLTRVPLGRLELTAEDVARGAFLFPAVGAGIGALVALTADGLAGSLAPFLAATVAVALEAVLTGAIHLDALADAADGLGAASRERALEAMRDPTIGAFGALALVLDTLLKVGAIAMLVAGDALLPVVAAFALGRAAPLGLGLALPYARAGSGSGRALTDGPIWPRAGGVVLAGAIAAAALGWDALVVAGAAVGLTLAIGVTARSRLGGVTGDVLGAATELVTTAGLLTAAATA